MRKTICGEMNAFEVCTRQAIDVFVGILQPNLILIDSYNIFYLTRLYDIFS